MVLCPGQRAASETRQLLSPSGSWRTRLRTISTSYHVLFPEHSFNLGAMRNTFQPVPGMVSFCAAKGRDNTFFIEPKPSKPSNLTVGALINIARP